MARCKNAVVVTDRTADIMSVTTQLPNATYQVFSEHARKIGKSRSEITRDLILRYLKEQDET